MLVLTHSMPHSLKHFIKEPKIKMIIKEGVVVDQSQHWREHKPVEIYEQVYEDLDSRVKSEKMIQLVEDINIENLPPEKVKSIDVLKNYYKKIRG